MSKIIFTCALLLSSICHADFNGSWKGNLSINGKSCKTTSIDIYQTPYGIAIYAAEDAFGNHALECGPKSSQYYMWLEEDFQISGNVLRRYDAEMGSITEQGISAQDRLCNPNGCEYWDYIKITRVNDKKISIWVDFDGAVLTGVLAK